MKQQAVILSQYCLSNMVVSALTSPLFFKRFIAASAHARAAIYFEIDKEFPCRFVWMDGWMDGVYANEELACVQTLLSTARESQIGTRYASLIRNFRVCLFVGMDGWSICK